MKTATRTDTLHHLSALTATLENDEVRKWKKQGGKVMGCLCSTIPEEMSIQPSWSAGSAATTERSRGKRSGFPLPRIREDRPRLHEDKLRGNDTGEANTRFAPTGLCCYGVRLRRIGCLRVSPGSLTA